MNEGAPVKQYIEEFNKAVLDYKNVARSVDIDHIEINIALVFASRFL
jgi:hypothetical protein